MSKNYAWVFAGTLLQIALQFLLQRVLARYFGAGMAMDAYRAALTFPAALSAMFVGTIVPVLIPKVSGDTFVARSLSTLVPIGSCAFTLAISGLAYFHSNTVTSYLVAGFGEERIVQTESLFKILVWLLPVNTLIGLFQGILNARQNFIVPAIAGVIGPIVTLAIVVNFSAAYGIQSCAWGTLLGGIANILIQLPFLVRLLCRVKRETWKEFGKLAIQAIPVLASMLIMKLDPFVERHVVSYLPSGSISYLDYALQVTTIFIALSSGTLSTVVFPRIAETAQKNRHRLPQEVAQAYQTLLLLTVPAMAVTFFFGEPLIGDLLQTGRFTAQDTSQVAMILAVYSLVILGAGLGEISVKTLYAIGDTWSPLWIGSSILLLGMILKLLLVPESGLMTYVAIVGLIYFPCSLFQLTPVFLRLGVGIFQGLGQTLLVAVIGSSAAMLVGWLVMQLNFRFSAVIGLVAGGVAYLLLVGLFGDTTIGREWHKLFNKQRE